MTVNLPRTSVRLADDLHLHGQNQALVRIRSRSVLAAAFVVYLFPLVTMLLLCVAYRLFGGPDGAGATTAGIAGLIVGLLLVPAVNRRWFGRGQLFNIEPTSFRQKSS